MIIRCGDQVNVSPILLNLTDLRQIFTPASSRLTSKQCEVLTLEWAMVCFCHVGSGYDGETVDKVGAAESGGAHSVLRVTADLQRPHSRRRLLKQ